MTKDISDLGKHILASCSKAYINKYGQIIDPCHVWLSEALNPASWDVSESMKSVKMSDL